MGTVLILVLVGLGILAAGFLIGRYYVPDDRMLKRQARRSRTYIQAVNQLLAADFDAAEQELKDLVQTENVADIEPYFALGALLRRKGQWEAAVRVHQAIKLREGQSKKIRLHAHYELGLDFCRAGMPRKATQAMQECLVDNSKHEGALRALCFLYEEQGRYADAAETWRKLAKVRGKEPPPRLHHLLVAAAQDAITKHDTDAARRFLREAERLDEHSVHALATWAELARERGNAKDATARLEQVLKLAPELARLLVPDLVAIQREMAVAQWMREHKRRADAPVQDHDLEREHDKTAMQMAVAVLERVRADMGHNGHIEMAMAELRSHFEPAVALADYQRIAETFSELLPARIAAARLALANGDADQIKRELEALTAPDGVLAWAMEGSWRCGHCGTRSDVFFWRCMQCRRWATVRLDIGRDALEAPEPRFSRAALRGGVDTALLGAAQARALPEPSLDSSVGAAELEHLAKRPTVLGRLGGWVSDRWAGMRSEPATEPPVHDSQEAPSVARLPAATGTSMTDQAHTGSAEPVVQGELAANSEPRAEAPEGDAQPASQQESQ